VGEAAYGPVAPALLSDLYPVRLRGRVIAAFYTAIPVGAALGYVLGGQIAGGTNLGWRWAFFMVVPPGVLLAVCCFLMRDPPRGQTEVGLVTRETPVAWRDYTAFLRIPSYVLNTLGMTAMTFAMGGLAWWMPRYLVVERQVPPLGPVDPRSLFGGILALAGLVATVLGGVAGDLLRRRVPGSYFLVSGAAMLFGFPMVLLVLWTPFPLAWVFVFLTVFCLFFNTGPTNTILANVTHPSIRASGFALNILVIHLFGDATSPAIIGALSDLTHGLATGFIVVSLLMLVGGVLWIWGGRYLEEDTRLAPSRVPGATPAAP
jgi:MFS family permease